MNCLQCGKPLPKKKPGEPGRKREFCEKSGACYQKFRYYNVVKPLLAGIVKDVNMISLTSRFKIVKM